MVLFIYIRNIEIVLSILWSQRYPYSEVAKVHVRRGGTLAEVLEYCCDLLRVNLDIS